MAMAEKKKLILIEIEDIRKDLEKLAKEQKRAIKNYIEFLLTEHVKEQKKKKP